MDVGTATKIYILNQDRVAGIEVKWSKFENNCKSLMNSPFFHLSLLV